MADADYGDVEPGEIATCLETEMCYRMDIGPEGVERPALHWDATFDETLSDATNTTWTLHVGDSFADVPRTNAFYSSIETLLHSDVTGGCTATEYCPGTPVSRAQMAVFVTKTFGLTLYGP